MTTSGNRGAGPKCWGERLRDVREHNRALIGSSGRMADGRPSAPRPVAMPAPNAHSCC